MPLLSPGRSAARGLLYRSAESDVNITMMAFVAVAIAAAAAAAAAAVAAAAVAVADNAHGGRSR